MNLSDILQVLVSGITNGAVYALVAAGLTLVFGLTKIVNFAHSSLMIIGAYVVVVVSPGGGGRFLLGLVAAGAVVGALSFALERSLFRFTIKSPLNGFIVSLGLILIIENLLASHFSSNPRFAEPFIGHIWSVDGAKISADNVVTVGLTFALFLLLRFILTRTRVGLALRAASVDREMVSILGFPAGRLSVVVFVVGGVLAGCAGALLVIDTPVTPTTGDDYIVIAFSVALLGGLGNAMGAVIGGLLMGVAQATLGFLGYGAWTQGAAFAALIVVLLLRPQGLFGGAEGKIG
jgi:branched-chain amino acid transport system permease protein